MKKHLVTLLTGLTAVSMAASMPVAVFAAESDAAAETTAEADQEVTMDTQEHAETTEPVAKALEAAKETEPSASTPEVQEETETQAPELHGETETSEPESVTSTPEVHEETVQNADGSTTTTTTSTITETTTTPLDPMVTTTPVNKEDSDYHTITDEDGNELEAYEKTTTTASSEVSTETVTTTTVTTETSQMTNAVETENATVENVTDAGNVTQADAETETAAKEFLEDQNVTSDFAIYADKVDESIGHVDGNVAVNTMATGGQVDIMNKDDSQYGAGNADPYAGNGYSYVGSTENGTTIKTTSNQTKDGEVLSKLVVGEDVTVTDNAHGSAGHFQLETATTKEEGGVTSESASHLAASDRRLADLEKTSDINQNLDQIAESGQKLIDATKDENGTGSADNDLYKIAAAIESLVQRQNTENSVIENGTNILNVTIHSRLLTDSRYTNDLNNRKIFQDLVKKNTSNTKVIVSVDCSDTDDSTGITAYFNPSNDINNYDNKAANLYWNFGSYKGKITFESQWVGNIIAANATVHANAGVQSGRIVARTAGHKAGEIHMAVSGNVATKKVTGGPVVTRSDKKTVIVSSEPSETYRYRPKDKTSEPDQPSEPTVPTEPSEPDQPSTPTVPDTPAEPGQPTTPVVPDTPSEPSQPTNPDVPENPSLPDNPDVPGTTDYTNPDTPDTDTNVVTTSVSEEPSAVENNIGDVSLINDESSHGEEQSQMVLGEIRTSETSVGLGEEQLAAGGSDRKNVQTGDESNMVLWGSLAAAALSAFGFVIEIKKRRF